MSGSVIVTVETVAGGFTATAKRGPHEHEAIASSAELAACLASARLMGVDQVDVRVVESRHGLWTATPRHGALVQEAAP